MTVVFAPAAIQPRCNFLHEILPARKLLEGKANVHRISENGMSAGTGLESLSKVLFWGATACLGGLLFDIAIITGAGRNISG